MGEISGAGDNSVDWLFISGFLGGSKAAGPAGGVDTHEMAETGIIIVDRQIIKSIFFFSEAFILITCSLS